MAPDMSEALRIYGVRDGMQEYEDDRLRDHAVEVVEQLNGILGDVEDDEGAAEREWEEDSDDDEGDGEDGDVEVEASNQHEDLDMNGT